MKLHGVVGSPFVQRVLVAARIKGIALELVPPPPGGLKSPEFMAISPMQRMPVLEDDDGWTLAESGAIVSYLDETQPGPSLFPEDAREAARARMVEMIADTELAGGLRHIILQKLFRLHDKPDLLAYGNSQWALGLDALEKIGIGRTGGWAVGDTPSVADAVLIPLFTLAEFTAQVSDGGQLMGSRPAVDEYWARVRTSELGVPVVRDLVDSLSALRQRQQQG